MRIILKLIISFFVSILFFSSVCYADGLTLGATRLVYDATKKEASVELYNSTSDSYYLVQSWVSNINTKNKKTPFVITPPLFKLFEKDVGSVRVVYIGYGDSALPSDRESVYLLNIRAIPAIEKKSTSNRLIIATQNVIKIIYRPEGLTSKEAELAGQKLTVKQKGNKLEIYNPTSYVVTLTNMDLSGEIIPKPGMVLPFSTLAVSTKSATIKYVKFSTINDFGGITKPIFITL